MNHFSHCTIESGFIRRSILSIAIDHSLKHDYGTKRGRNSSHWPMKHTVHATVKKRSAMVSFTVSYCKSGRVLGGQRLAV